MTRQWFRKVWPTRSGSGEEAADSLVEPPGAAVVVEHVLVPTDELHGPAFVAHQEKDEVAGGAGLVIVPVGDQRVEHEVALGPPRCHARIRLAQRVMALVGAEAGNVAAAVGAERGDDVVGAAVVQGERVRGDRGAHALGDVGEAQGVVHFTAPGRDRASAARTDTRSPPALPGATGRGGARPRSRRSFAGSSRCGPRACSTAACTRSLAGAGPSAVGGCSRSPARGSPASADRRVPTPPAGWVAVAPRPRGTDRATRSP